MKLQGFYNCRVLQKRGNRKLVKLDSSISPGGVDITIVPITTLQDVEPSRAVVASGVTMRALLEKEKKTTDLTAVNNAVLEMKLAGQITQMKDPGFSQEILATMATIARGKQHSIWKMMKLMLEEWPVLCFQRARGQECDMCKHQDKKGGSLAKEKLFCSGIGMQFLNMEQTYYIARSKTEDNEHILYLPQNQTTVVQLAKFLPIILDAEERRGIKAPPGVFNTIINKYGLSAPDSMIRAAIKSIPGGQEYKDGRLYIVK